jgi:DNA-binding XRE family transcriptional regulator
MNPVHEIIKASRVRLGLTEDEVSKRAGISWNEYFDIELNPKEALEVARLGQVKRVCEVLGLDVLDLFDISCAYCGPNTDNPCGEQGSRSRLISRRRTELGMSVEGLADRIGFDPAAIRDMEMDPMYLDRWPVELVLELSGVLDIPPQRLLGVKCMQCGS